MEDQLPAADSSLVIRSGEKADVARLETHWCALYQHQREHGMLLAVPDNGFQQWAAPLASMLGRYACLFIAEEHGEIVGFLAGRIRSVPPYFGGFPCGFISDVFVSDAQRSRGIGEKLLDAASQWFQAHDIKRIELQVIINNVDARRFYQKHGWQEELVQMVWLAKSDQ
jgi:GNAT superfamily N-acetyltransferase